MRLRNRTRTGNICSQNIAWEWLRFGDRSMRAGCRQIAIQTTPRLRECLALDSVTQDTHPLDLHFEDIARLHVNRWLARGPNAAGCSGDDHIPRLESHRDADQ